MSAELWVTLIVGIAVPVCSLIGVIITVKLGNKKQFDKVDESNKKQAEKVDEYKELTIYRIEQLEKKQDKHNTLIERMFRAEGHIEELQHEIRDLKEGR